MEEKLSDQLKAKSNEVLEGILIFLSPDIEEVTFESFETKFPDIKGKQLGSLFSAITRSEINGKHITVSIPQFGSRRKNWKLNKSITEDELKVLKDTILGILEERK